MQGYSPKNFTYRGSDPRNPRAQFEIDLQDAQKGLEEAKESNDLRVVKMMKARVRAAVKGLKEVAK